MNRAIRAAAVLFVALLGLWGCAQGPTATAQAERIKALESKSTRLETDFRAAAAARDQVRQQLVQSEEHVHGVGRRFDFGQRRTEPLQQALAGLRENHTSR